MTILIGDVPLDGEVVNYNESAGMNAPERKTEKGFSYSSLVDSEPITADIEAWVEPETYGDLSELRDNGEPFEVTVDMFDLGECKLENLEVNNDASAISHFNVTIRVKQVQTAETDTATLSVDAGDGEDGGQMNSSSAQENPTLVRSQEEEGSDDSDGFDPIGDLKDWMGF